MGYKLLFTINEAMVLRRAYEDGVSIKLIADLHNVSRSATWSHLQRSGTKMRRGGLSGKDHYSWKGGRSVKKDGYVSIWISSNDPMRSMCSKGYRVPEHRLVMARAIGRPLTNHETVHHIDGDKQNNKIENLQLFDGNHGNRQAFVCRCCGSTNVGPIALGGKAHLSLTPLS